MLRTIQITVKVALFVGLSIIFSNCNSEKSYQDKRTISSKLDTIYQWIEDGKNSELSHNLRTQQLKKAADAAQIIIQDSLKTKIYSQLSLAYLYVNDSLKFRNANRETLTLAEKTNDSMSLAEAHWDLGEFFKNEAIADSAYFHFSEAQKTFQFLGEDYESAAMLNNMAIVQGVIKDYTGSEITTIKAIEIFKPLKNYEQLYNSYSNLGSVTKELKEFDRALEYYNTALEYQKKIKFKNNYNLDVQNNIGVVYQEKSDFEKSLEYFEKILKTKNLLETETKLYALTLNNLASSKFKSGDKTDLRGIFEKAIQIQDSINDIFGISRTHYNFADYYLNQNDTTNALNQAKKAYQYAKLANNNERILETLRILSKTDPNKSSLYNQEYITLNDSLQEEERQIRDKFARIRFETDEYIAENEMLASEKQLWTGISVAIFLLGASAFVILSQRSKNQKLRFQQEQQAANQEIFNLMLSQKQKEEEGKKSEQKRISEELHDGVLGKMMGARMVLTGLNQKKDPDAEIQRKKAIDALQDVEKEVRTISHELSHTAYQKINNFILSIQDLLKSVEQTAAINCTLVYDKEWEWDSLNGEIKINTYRMIQECLQNSVKHAQCKNVTVTFVAQKGSMQISIADDGAGFRKTRKKKGIGMRNIASRMEKLKGKWRIDSSPGKGTTVHLEIPVTCTENHVSKSMMKPELSSQV
ncbi:MAG: tetratricopeptide repeat protein [Pricia sp.]